MLPNTKRHRYYVRLTLAMLHVYGRHPKTGNGNQPLCVVFNSTRWNNLSTCIHVAESSIFYFEQRGFFPLTLAVLPIWSHFSETESGN